MELVDIDSQRAGGRGRGKGRNGVEAKRLREKKREQIRKEKKREEHILREAHREIETSARHAKRKKK